MNWIDFDWSGLNWGSINWNGLDWSGLNWGDFNPGSLNWNSLDWSSLDLGNLDWSNLNWSNLNWGSLNLGNVNFASLNWGDLNWGDLNWGDLNWGSLNSGDSDWGTIDWPNFDWSGLNWSGLNWSGLNWNNFDWGIFDWFSSGFGLGLSINIPNVPIDIRGNGTYADPWAISLTIDNVPDFEILVWLDPDGLPRPEGIQEVFSLVGDDVMDLIGDAISSIDAPSLPDGWNTSVASMIHRLSGLHPAAAHAVGYMGLTEIQTALDRFESFLSASDGLVSVDSQGDIQGSGTSWSSNSPSGIHNAHHLNSLRTSSIIQEVVNFHASQGIGANAKILFIAPEWMGLGAWSDMISGLSSSISPSSTAQTTTDLSSSGPLTLAQIQSFDLSSLDHQAPFHVLVPSLNVHADSNLPEFLAHQVKVLVDHIFSQSGHPVFLIGHSVGGLAARYYSEGIADIASNGTPSPPEDRVYGATTISTPHYNSTQSLADITRDGLFKFMHLLRLMGSIGDADLSSIDPSVLPLSDVLGAEGLPNLTEEYLRQLATLLFNEDVTTIFPGMDNA